MQSQPYISKSWKKGNWRVAWKHPILNLEIPSKQWSWDETWGWDAKLDFNSSGSQMPGKSLFSEVFKEILWMKWLIKIRGEQKSLSTFCRHNINSRMKKITCKKTCSGLTSPNKLFFYLFCVAGFCYQPNRQIVANFVMVEADILFPNCFQHFSYQIVYEKLKKPQYKQKRYLILLH